ncbi:MAG TPA: PrsW family glutamic-type intramembrane protease [Gemmataceae bacterium]|jgi:RsiW-degrading membrane proteinase PrsW (M82 family)|nr:PrsW family glutamic-type intramembrane protease [Gemmataceae bacterium]
MPITVVCACQKRLRAPDALAGKRAKCPACGAAVLIPESDGYTLQETKFITEPEPSPNAPAPRKPRTPRSFEDEEEPTREPEYVASRKPRSFGLVDEEAPSIDRYRDILDEKPQQTWRNFTYWVLLLALIPLVFSLFGKEGESVEARFDRTIRNAPPPVQERIVKVISDANEGKAGEEAIFAELPGGRIEGAHLSRKSKLHYLYGLLAIGCYFILGLLLLRDEDSHPWHLLLVGLFTSTFGILFLLLAQFLASATQGFILFRGNIVVLAIFWIAWAIGFSYRAALDPSYGFLASFMGFTFGVGLCEEVCKALPIITYYRRSGGTSWHKALTWGFSSGVGFGVAEAIMYCGNHYNGVLPPGAYVVRFVSCVTLHAIWAVSTALFMHKNPWLIQGADTWHSYIPRVIAIVSVPMVLHGLYDTALKKELSSIALIAALLSFAWLVFCMETTRGLEHEKPRKKRRRAQVVVSG